MDSGMEEKWRAIVEKAFPQGHAAGFPGYPLLGAELSGTAGSQVSPWKLRLTLRESFEAPQMKALFEDVEEVRWAGAESAELLEFLGDRQLYLEASGSATASTWTLTRTCVLEASPFPTRSTEWTREGESRTELEAQPDGQILRNMAWLKARGDEQSWVVSSSRSASGEADELIADTLAYLTGAVAGVGVLEVAQQEGEGFASLWNRLCAVRLLRHEAELSLLQDPLQGAGFFSQIEPELSGTQR